MTERLSTDFYQLKGEFTGVKERLDKIDGTLARMDDRLARMEEAESQRKGVVGLMHWLAGAVGGAIVLVIEHFWK